MNALVTVEDGIPSTTSLRMAQKFKKLHRDVLRAYKNLECSAEFRLRNFAQSSWVNAQGKEQPMVVMSRDGFSFLAMGFTGKEAAKFKEDYIAEFNAMETELKRRAIQTQDAYWQQKRLEGKNVRFALTDTVQTFVSYAKQQGSQNAEKYYMSITKMEYAALELVKQSGDKHFRDSLDAIQHTQLSVVEYAAQEALRRGMDEGLHYKDIFQLAKNACVQLAAQLRKFLPQSAASAPLAQKIARSA